LCYAPYHVGDNAQKSSGADLVLVNSVAVSSEIRCWKALFEIWTSERRLFEGAGCVEECSGVVWRCGSFEYKVPRNDWEASVPGVSDASSAAS
jgi:hypothetical protein